MPYDKVLEVINLLDKYGVFRITLTGGEPLIRNDIFNIINELKSRSFCVDMNTNGTLITEEVSRKLKNVGLDSIRISLDGSNQISHDYFRGVKGSFTKAIKAIELLKKDNHRVNITTIINRLNMNEIEDIYKIINNYEIEEWHFFRLLPTGNAVNNKELILDKKEYIQVMREVKKIKNRNSKTNISFNDPIYSLIDIKSSDNGGCGAGKLYLGINTKGEFSLCPSMSKPIGNIFDENLENIFAKKIVREARNNSLIKKCVNCKYNNICGGCCSASYLAYGDDFIQDPFCIKDLIGSETE
jgi:radical SAM protein with 4Fe4S-binding SPASM domain